MYPPERDGDGMPDAWELSHGLNPDDPSDAVRPAKGVSGYLNIEVYINDLLAGSGASADRAPAGSVPGEGLRP